MWSRTDASSPRQGGGRSPSPASAAWYWSLAGLTLVGVVTRVIALNSGMWIDEIYSLVRSFRQPLGTILTDYWGDTHHPLYAVLAHVSRGIFGEAPWTVRLPAVLFGVATIPVLAILARRVVPPAQALLAALLLAVSYHHVWFSQNARGYSAIACFTVMAMLFAMKGLASGRAVDWGLYALVAALGTYTHLTMAFVVIGHAVAVAVEMWRRSRVDPSAPLHWKPAGAGFLASAALTVVLYAPMLPGVIAFFTQTRSKLEGVSTPAWAAVETIRVLALGMSGGVAALGVVVAAAGLAIAFLGGWSIGRRSPLFLLLLIAPIGVTLAGAAIARGTLYPRFFFFAIGPALVVAIHGTFVLAEWIAARLTAPQRGSALGTAACGLVIAISVFTLPLNYRYPKQDFGGAMDYASNARALGDAIVSTGVPADPYRTLYGRDWPNITTLAELDRLRAGQRVWVLSTFSRYIAARAPDLVQVLNSECQTTRIFRGTVSGGDIQVCALDRK